MDDRFEQYVRPAVLRLDFEMDVKVSLAQPCKTTATAASGSSPCNAPGGTTGMPCSGSGS